MNKDYNNILVVKFGAIGDVIMATPTLRALRKRFPKAHISLLVGEWSKEAAEGNPNLDELIVVDDAIFVKKQLLRVISLVRSLRKRKFDLVVNLHRSLAMNLFTRFVAKERAGFNRSGEGRFNTIRVDCAPIENLHEAQKYLEVAKAIGAPEEELEYDFYFSEEDESAARKFLADSGVDLNKDRVLGFMVGGGRNPGMFLASKQWGVDKWAELAGMVIESLGAKVVFLGDRDDYLAGEDVRARMRHKAANLCGKTTIKQAGALIGLLNLIVTPDSALMHIGAAVGTPVIALFGPTDPKLYAPKGSCVIFKGESCSPCYREGKFPPCKENKCVQQITPSEVFETVEKVIVTN